MNWHVALHKNWSFPLRISSVRKTWDILNGKLRFLCSARFDIGSSLSMFWVWLWRKSLYILSPKGKRSWWKWQVDQVNGIWNCKSKFNLPKAIGEKIKHIFQDPSKNRHRIPMKYSTLLPIEAVVRRCSVKKYVLKNFTKFTGTHLCQSLFLNKASGLRPQVCNFIKKELLAQVFSCEFCKMFKNTYFCRTPLMAASVLKGKRYSKTIFTSKKLWKMVYN